MSGSVVVTGLGMVTPLGTSAPEILARIKAGEKAARPTPFDFRHFACQVCAEIPDFKPEAYVGESKTLRLMGRDALLAVAAARLAMADAGLKAGPDYPPEDIALYGATGLAGLPLAEVQPLIRHSALPDGAFDPRQFGAAALKRVRPVLSFKILSNMPICFVSMFEAIQGPNAVYNPWEGQGAQAIAAGVRAIECGDAPAALVGGCDVKTHELAFIGLEQRGIFGSWRTAGEGCIPGEGAAFLVLEQEAGAVARGARHYARIAGFSVCTTVSEQRRPEAYEALLSRLPLLPAPVVVSAADGDRVLRQAEEQALARVGLEKAVRVRPKAHLGNLFAAAAAVQVGLAAALAGQAGRVLANCFGYGREQAAFVLEKA
jgi:3-oxoacyl-[acyl-carrier-protein] synthase II